VRYAAPQWIYMPGFVVLKISYALKVRKNKARFTFEQNMHASANRVYCGNMPVLIMEQKEQNAPSKASARQVHVRVDACCLLVVAKYMYGWMLVTCLSL
jgi:hypothetical protein